MSNDPFFKLRGVIHHFDTDQFNTALSTSKHMCNFEYRPDVLSSRRVKGITFENVSFSKTCINRVEFRDCIFKDCRFIGTKFKEVNFHACKFDSCNFYRSSFDSVYGKPAQFERATPGDAYTNVGVHLYQELRNNYVDEAQPEFMREADYQFHRWSQKLLWSEIYSDNKFQMSKLLRWMMLALYKVAFGYGLRLRNLAVTTVFLIVTLSGFAKVYADTMFSGADPITWVKSFYFTVSTMVTLGAIGFNPANDRGYLYLLVNVLVGIVLLSATLNAFSKRVSR